MQGSADLELTIILPQLPSAGKTGVRHHSNMGFKKKSLSQVVVVHPFNLSTREAEGSWEFGASLVYRALRQPELHINFALKKPNQIKNKHYPNKTKHAKKKFSNPSSQII